MSAPEIHQGAASEEGAPWGAFLTTHASPVADYSREKVSTHGRSCLVESGPRSDPGLT